MINKEIYFQDLGRIGYMEAWQFQDKLFNHILEIKKADRKSNNSDNRKKPTPNYLIFCEHPHVYTLGKNGSADNLLISDEIMKEKSIQYVHTNRGGDITYHGPGQIVGYPVLDLENFFTDIRKYMQSLEDTVISTLSNYGITSERLKGYPGVWLDTDDPLISRKICAMGVKSSRWVTMHGWALNVHTELSYFDYIIPCGIKDKSVTSIQKETGRYIDKEEVKALLRNHFTRIFNARITETSILPNASAQ